MGANGRRDGGGLVVGFGFGGYGGVVASDVVVVSREGVG